ncbi:MAG: ribosome maturation factor RimM [Lachnospiraceae bacterium]|nr:ribosome maturation factor RimM [Lachnospiraceae bacterium]
MQEILQVGAVTSTHGLAGEVKVFPTTDDPKRYLKLKSVLIEKPARVPHDPAGDKNYRKKSYSQSEKYTENPKGSDLPPDPARMRELEIERVRFFKNLVIVKFRGLDRIEDVEGFRGCALYVTRENAVRLEDGEYFIADLIGLTVYADEPVCGEENTNSCEDRAAGETPETASGQAFLLGELSDVLQTGANDVYEVTLTDGREVLIPAIRQCILDVDLEKGTMLVHLLEGLLE